MATHFLCYWKPRTYAEQIDSGNITLTHTASDQLDPKRITSGDVLWFVTSRERRRLTLFGRQIVGRIVTTADARRLLGTSNLWNARWHVISTKGSEEVVHDVDISGEAHALRFVGDVRRLPVDFSGQHLQRVRTLALESADLLQTLWDRSRQGLGYDTPSSVRVDRALHAGQGYEDDPVVRRAIELHAMSLANEHYKKLGFDRIDTSRTRPYDVLCKRDGVREIRVEVKGTRGAGEEVELTAAEVENARAMNCQTDLFIVSGIAVQRVEGIIKATGGSVRVVEGWQPATKDLMPIRFRYRIPK